MQALIFVDKDEFEGVKIYCPNCGLVSKPIYYIPNHDLRLNKRVIDYPCNHCQTGLKIQLN